MVPGILYKTSRGNQDKSVGLIVKGATASIQVLGSQSNPDNTSDMVDCTDAELLDEGTWTFSMFPEYIYFLGTADSIEIIGMSIKEVGAIA